MTSDGIKLCGSHTINGIGKFTGNIRLQQVQILLQKYNFALLFATTDQNQILVGCKKFVLTTCKNLIRTELIRECMVKWATSFFNSLCCDVEKQVTRF